MAIPNGGLLRMISKVGSKFRCSSFSHVRLTVSQTCFEAPDATHWGCSWGCRTIGPGVENGWSWLILPMDLGEIPDSKTWFAKMISF